MFGGTTALGVDIGAHTVRAALIQQQKHGIQLQALVAISRHNASLDDALNHIKQQLKKACKAPWHWPSQQIMGVAQSSVATKRFAVSPNLPVREQYVQIGLQLSESLGLPMDELLYDYRELPGTEGVEVYACRKPLLDETLSSIERSGFKLSVIELQTHALMRLYRQHALSHHASETCLMLDVGAERLQLCLDDGKQGQFFRELPAPVADHETAAGRAVLTAHIADALQRQYQLASTQWQGAPVNTLWLSGEHAKYLDAAKLEHALGWQVKALNPLYGLRYSPSVVEGLQESAVAWSTCIGLALRGVAYDA